jgi:hypothetical protein
MTTIQVIELYIPLVPHLWLHTLGFRIVFLIVLLIGIFCDFYGFILQIVPTFLGVAGSGFWAMFVIQQTNRLMQPLIYRYLFGSLFILFIIHEFLWTTGEASQRVSSQVRWA